VSYAQLAGVSGFNSGSEPAITSVTEKKRICASLKGVATGDAIGKQTENLSRDGIAQSDFAPG
jgi:hypothetical protein